PANNTAAVVEMVTDTVNFYEELKCIFQMDLDRGIDWFGEVILSSPVSPLSSLVPPSSSESLLVPSSSPVSPKLPVTLKLPPSLPLPPPHSAADSSLPRLHQKPWAIRLLRAPPSSWLRLHPRSHRLSLCPQDFWFLLGHLSPWLQYHR
ncbi:hypothetical protein M9458_034900, partial [Cirrhinus mrigala]